MWKKSLLAGMVLWFGGMSDVAMAGRHGSQIERQLAFHEASQTIQRLFTCISDALNADGDTMRDLRAQVCLRENFAPDAVVVFNNVPIPGIETIIDTFTGQGGAAGQFTNTIQDVHTMIDRGFTPRSGRRHATMQIRATVVTFFTNTVSTPILPLPPGNYILHAAEEFMLEEVAKNEWMVKRVEATLISNVPIPDNSFPVPFPEVPSILRSR